MVCTTCLKTCRTTKNLECQEIRKDQMNLKTSFYSPIPIATPTIIFFQYYQKTPEKKMKMNISRSALLNMKIRVCLRYFVHDWKRLNIDDYLRQVFTINFLCSRCSYILATNQDLLLIALILVCNIFNETLFPVEIMRYKLYRYMRENIRNWNMKFFI